MRSETNITQQTKDIVIQILSILRIKSSTLFTNLLNGTWVKGHPEFTGILWPRIQQYFYTPKSLLFLLSLFLKWKLLFTLSLLNPDLCDTESHLVQSNKVHCTSTELTACYLWYFWSNTKTKTIPRPVCLITSFSFSAVPFSQLWFCAHY